MPDHVVPIVTLADLPLTDHGNGARYQARAAQVAGRLGLKGLGARLVELPPGKRAWPRHHHYANEELVVILEGQGLWRFGAESRPVRAGDVLGAPAGGPETAHQLENDSDAPLRYLVVSTMHAPDVMGYPDSGKVAIFAGAPPGGDKAARTLEYVGRLGPTAGYWEGEDGPEE